ncbi:MAG: SDR family oxidoreductase [Spirochaetaceae bacterium]|nr:MAG: SDR family oxidoreductase [Spirochaetaceae bacterium]
MAQVCITGASRGIGLGFATAYLAQGDRVFGAVRNPDSRSVTELRARYPDSFTPVQMDVSSRLSVEQAAREIAQQTDSLELLINNAGISRPPDEQCIEDVSETDIRSVFEVNTLGPLRVTQQLFPLLRAGRNAKVVMISSNAGSIAGQGGGRGVPYCLSKAGLNMLTKLLWFHCSDEGVAIAALHPGWVATDMGGENGTLSVQQSVSSMMQLIARLHVNSPLYVDYSGKEMEW